MLVSKVLLRHPYKFNLPSKSLPPSIPPADPLLAERHLTAAIKIQRAFRRYQARAILKKLKKSKDTLYLLFSDGQKHPFHIYTEESLRNFIKFVTTHIHRGHKAIKIELGNLLPSRYELNEKIRVLKDTAKDDALQFNFSKHLPLQIIVEPKRIQIEVLNGRIQYTYSNGIIENFIYKGSVYQGDRHFPDGKKEHGEFDGETGELIAGYILRNNVVVDFKISHSLHVSFSDNCEMTINNRNANDLKASLHEISEKFQSNSNHKAARIALYRKIEEEPFKEIFKQVAKSYALKSIFTRTAIIVRPKPQKIEHLPNGKILTTYQNGTTEKFRRLGKELRGTCIDSNGKREKGWFDIKTRKHIFGFTIENENPIAFINMSYKIEVVIPSQNSKSFDVQSPSDIVSILDHLSDKLNYAYHATIVEIGTRIDHEICMKSFEILAAPHFDIFRYGDSSFVIQPKPIETEHLANDKIKWTYANGVVEELTLKEEQYQSTRSFPGGEKEEGSFHKITRMLVSGCKINGKGVKEEGKFDETTGQLVSGLRNVNGEISI